MRKLTASLVPLLIGLSAYVYESDARILHAAVTPADGQAVHVNGQVNESASTQGWEGVVICEISQFDSSHQLVLGSSVWVGAALLGWKNGSQDAVVDMPAPSLTGITPLPAPVLKSPIDRATNVSLTPTLSWGLVEGAESYHVQVTEFDFREPIYENVSVEGSEYHVEQLPAYWTFRWRVRARRGAEYGAWSETRSFTTLWLNSPPYAYNPVNDTTVTVGAEYTIPYIFVDDDWTPLTYAVSSSDDEVVTVKQSGWEITVAAISVGSATITATATDPQGASATHSFKVTVAASTNSEHTARDLPGAFALHQNYPNPFNPRTVIAFDLPRQSSVTLKLYDALGKELATLASGEFSAGKFQVSWDASRFPSGVYLYRLEADTYSETRRLVLQR